MIETQSGRLLRRGHPKPDESLWGYILRLGEANGYEKPYWIAQMLGLNLNTLYKGAFLFDMSLDWSGLAQLSGAGLNEIIALTYPPDGDSPTFTNLFFGMPVPKYVIRPVQAKICPACLADSAHCRRMWEFTLVTVCPTHNSLLVDECPGCRQRVSWSRNRVCCCRCNYDWRDIPLTPVEGIELELTRQIYRLCKVPGFDECSTIANPLCRLDLNGLVTVVLLIASQYEGITDTRGKQLLTLQSRNSAIHAIICRALQVFETWPSNYFSFLDWRRSHLSDTKYVGGLSKDFGGFYVALYRKHTAHAFKFLRDAFEEYLRTRWIGGYLASIRNQSLNRNLTGLMPQKQYLSRVEAAARLKSDFEKVDNLINSGTLRAVVHQEGKKRRILVDADSLEETCRWRENLINRSDVCNLLGITGNAVIDLVKHGVLNLLPGATPDGQRKRQFSRREVQLLLERITGNIRESPGTKHVEVVGLKQALRVFRYCEGYGMGRFVRAILDGLIRPCGKSQTIGLGGLLFLKDELQKYRLELRRVSNHDLIGIVEAAEDLGFNLGFTYHLCHTGILPATKKHKRGSSPFVMTMNDIKSFKDTYMVLAKKEALKLNTTVRRLVISLKAQGILPLTGPIIDGATRYLYKRSDLESIDLAKTSGEAKVKLKQEQKIKYRYIFNAAEAAKRLGTTVKIVNELAACGVLPTYIPRTREAMPDDGYYFSYYVLESYRRLQGEISGLVSTSVAASMLNESLGAFHQSWVRAGYIKPVKVTGAPGRNYFRRADINTLVILKQGTMNLQTVTRSLGVRSGIVLDWIKSGMLQPVPVKIGSANGYYRFLKDDVDKIREKLKAA
jgi:hypothetical protein